jgi:hypothetical protein
LAFRGEFVSGFELIENPTFEFVGDSFVQFLRAGLLNRWFRGSCHWSSTLKAEIVVAILPEIAGNNLSEAV